MARSASPRAIFSAAAIATDGYDDASRASAITPRFSTTSTRSSLIMSARIASL
jgi:hypothetical protein